MKKQKKVVGPIVHCSLVLTRVRIMSKDVGRRGFMSKTGFSRKSSSCSYMHFDNDGNLTGCSKTASLFGDIFHYDKDNNKIGYSNPALFGGYVHYNQNGEQTGRSDPAPGGGYFHYDANGNQTGYSVPAPLDGFIHYDL